MQVVCLLASNHNKFSFVFDCCFSSIDICRLPWPWDARLLKRRQYREDLGNSPFWRSKLPIFPLFYCFCTPCKPLLCPQSLLGSIQLFCWVFCVVCLTKSFTKLVISQWQKAHFNPFLTAFSILEGVQCFMGECADLSSSRSHGNALTLTISSLVSPQWVHQHRLHNCLKYGSW